MEPYVSPISFLPPNSSATLSSKEIKLAKQKLLAEFELAGTTTIQAGGKEMSRNDVLKLFEQLSLSNDLDYHMLVASDPILLHFLKQYEMLPGKEFSIPEDKITNEFIEWLSPYFSWAFRKTTTRIFRNVNPVEFETLIVCQRLMTENDEWEAWSGVESYLEITLKSFEEINNSKYHTPAQASKYAGYNFVWLLCNLPEERFSQLIDNYAFELMRLAIKEFNRKQREYAFEIMGYAKSLKVSESTMYSLQRKDEEMQQLHKKNSKVETRNSLWGYVRVAAVVLYILSHLANCNSTG